MRTFRRLVAVLILVGGAGVLLLPAAAGRVARPHVRRAPRAVVHGHVTSASQDLPTSLETFSERSRPNVPRTPVAPPTSALSPSTVMGFDGMDDLDGFVPADPTGALGDDVFVAAVNSSVEVFDRNGVSIVPRVTLSSLAGEPSMQYFDPKVVYDQYADTFVLVWLGQADSPRMSRIFTAAIPNATATDTSTWCVTDLAGDQIPSSPNLWSDYPAVGYNDTRLTIATNMFTFPSFTALFRYSQIMTIDKSLYDCTQPAPVPTVFGGTETRDANGKQAFTVQPAQSVGTSPGAQLLVSFRKVDGASDYLVPWRIKPTATGFNLKTGCCVPTGKVSEPPLGSQGGGGLSDPDFFWDAGDTRLINAFYDADRNELFAAHTVFRNLKPDTVQGGYPEAAVRWYELDPAANLKRSILTRRGVIGSPEVDLGWPSVATDVSGTLFVTYSRASAPHDEFLSAWVATIPPDSTTDTQLLLRAGSARYDVNNGPERWGDFTAINRDPRSSDHMATFNQYASSGSTWQHFISVVTDD